MAIISQVVFQFTERAFFKPQHFVKRLVANDDNGDTNAIINYALASEEVKGIFKTLEQGLAYPDVASFDVYAEKVTLKTNNVITSFPLNHLQESIQEAFESLIETLQTED